MIRSRYKWINVGEKTTKNFCSTEKRNYIRKAIPNVIKAKGSLTESESVILTLW